jgi:preprotein translocase subunit SecD
VSTRRSAALLLAAVFVGYLLTVFLTRDVWTDRPGTRVSLAVQTRDGQPPSAEDMTQASDVAEARLRSHHATGVDVTTEGATVIATFSGHDPDTAALREMFGPGETKTMVIRPVIHAIAATPQSPPPAPKPAGDPAKAIDDEKKLRQSTDTSIQVLSLQFQASRCGQDDVLAGHDDPNLPLVTCSADGTAVYLLDSSILGGDQVRNASAGHDPDHDQHVVVLEFDDAASKTWADYTATHVGGQAAFTIDTRVVSAPQIQESIPGGTVQITGQFDADSAQRLADAINRGSSPVALSFQSSADQTLPAPTISKIVRGAVITTGVLLVAATIAAAVFLRRRS